MCDHRYPTKTCGRSNLAVRSSWDNVSSPDLGGRASREGARRLLALRRSGTRVDGMANSSELPINVVRTGKPKMLIGLNQNGMWPSAGVFPFPCRRYRATGEQAEPKPSVIHPWNVVSPSSSPRGRPAVRRTLMGRRVGDEGGSERRPVIGRRGVEPSGEITPRESGPTSLGCLRTRPSDQLEKGRKPDYGHQGGGSRRCDQRSFLLHTSGSAGGATRSYGWTCYDRSHGT